MTRAGRFLRADQRDAEASGALRDQERVDDIHGGAGVDVAAGDLFDSWNDQAGGDLWASYLYSPTFRFSHGIWAQGAAPFWYTDPMDDARAERSRLRSSWPVRISRLGAEGGVNIAATTSPEERLAMMWPLAREAWSLAGWQDEPLPRSQWPVRVTTLSEQ